MPLFTNLMWEILLTNYIIGLTFINLLRLLLRLFPSRVPTRFQLCVAFVAVYALAIAINIVLPDFFSAVEAFGSAQSVCVQRTASCYAFGGAAWTDNFTLKHRRALVVCNVAYFNCYMDSVFGSFAMIVGSFW